MINLQKAYIFKKYRGNIDSWLNNASPDERAIFKEGEWAEIESIVFDLSTQKMAQKRQEVTRPVVERKFTPASAEVIAEANAYAERFSAQVEGSEYEAVLAVLYELA